MAAVVWAVGVPWVGPAEKTTGLGGDQVGVVEEVEDLGAELQAGAFGDVRGLEEREVPVGEVGAGEGVAAEVADGAVGGREEGGGVEELRHALGLLSRGCRRSP